MKHIQLSYHDNDIYYVRIKLYGLNIRHNKFGHDSNKELCTLLGTTTVEIDMVDGECDISKYPNIGKIIINLFGDDLFINTSNIKNNIESLQIKAYGFDNDIKINNFSNDYSETYDEFKDGSRNTVWRYIDINGFTINKIIMTNLI